MMILTDCISLEEPIPEGLLDFIERMSDICEVRAVAYKDLQSAANSREHGGRIENNLYTFWLMLYHPQRAMDDTSNSVALRNEFYRTVIEEHCRQKLEIKNPSLLKESPFFDEGVFEETMHLIETYYRLDK